MSTNERAEKIHISEIDECLASKTLARNGASIGIHVEKSGDEGYILVTDTEESGALNDKAVDFELSPSEYQNLEDKELDDLLTAPLITSSALELFDFLLLRFSSFSCFLEFTGNAWKVDVYNFRK